MPSQRRAPQQPESEAAPAERPMAAGDGRVATRMTPGGPWVEVLKGSGRVRKAVPRLTIERDQAAASPLVVIATFVVAAVVLTVVVYAVAFDRPADRLDLVQGQDGEGNLQFTVGRTAGGLAWSQVDLQFVDRAGTDVARSILVKPNGTVARGDVVATSSPPPAGTYLLLAMRGGTELSRLVVVL